MNKPIIQTGYLLKSDCDIIVQQLNCLCVKPHGLSYSIAKKYPYANVYSQRTQEGSRNLAIDKDRGTPGNIVVSTSVQTPVVIGLYGQYDFGKAVTRNYRPSYDPPETSKMREKWFKKSLKILAKWLDGNELNCGHIKIGFPYGIGCGLAGGDWSKYLVMIEKFTKDVHCQVVILKLKNAP